MPVRTNIQVTGVRELVRAGEKMREEDAIRISDGLREYGAQIFLVSQILVPKDTGDLAASGHLITTGSGFFAHTIVEYGGVQAPYAWMVHEDMEAYHEPPTQAKYLLTAVEATVSAGREILGRSILSTGAVPLGR